MKRVFYIIFIVAFGVTTNLGKAQTTKAELWLDSLQLVLFTDSQDSIEVSDAEIRSNVDFQLQQFLAQSGKSMEELSEGESQEKQ